jgi:hypothetical protein
MDFENLPDEFHVWFKSMNRASKDHLETSFLPYCQKARENRDNLMFAIGNSAILLMSRQAQEEMENNKIDLISCFEKWMQEFKELYKQKLSEQKTSSS